MLELLPKKCCVKYEPPTFILFYELPDEKKLHRRSIPIKGITLKDGDEILENLMESHHGKYLKKFKQSQVIRMLNLLIEKNGGTQINPETNASILGEVNIEEDDLNKLDDDKLNEVKKHMNSSFEQNQVKPGDKDWKYDIEVDFQDNDVVGGIEAAGWDDDDSDMEF